MLFYAQKRPVFGYKIVTSKNDFQGIKKSHNRYHNRYD